MFVPITFSLVLVLLSSAAVVEGFSNYKSKISQRSHLKSRALHITINSKDRDGKKLGPSNNIRARRDPKNSARKELSSFFGFTSTAELFNGRVAMIFFLFGMYEEFKTGKSILQQVGLVNQDQQVNGFMFAALFGAMALYPSISKWLTKLSAIGLKDPNEM